MTLLRWLISLLGSLTVTLTVLQFWTYFFLLMPFYFTVAFPPLGNSDHVVVSVSTDFSTNSKWDILFILLIEMVFEIIWEMFYGRIYLNSVLLLLLVNFVSKFRLKLMYISLIINLPCLLVFSCLVLLSWFIEITFLLLLTK